MKKTLEDLLFEMGAAVGLAFVRGVESASASDGGRKIAAKPQAKLVSKLKRAAAKPCVLNCGRQSAAKGLCSNHYAKAKRLKMNLDAKLTPAQRKTLATDGRRKVGDGSSFKT